MRSSRVCKLIHVSATVAILALSLCGCSGSPSAASNRPNIVFILTDDLSTNLVTKQFMPNLWALEKDGAIFSRYFVTDSLCCPSRSSIFTGRYPHDTGVFTNVGLDGGYSVFEKRDDEASTVATDLHAAGYRTAMMGKYLNLYDPLTDPPAPGWDVWDVAGSAYPEFHYWLNENGKHQYYGGPHQRGHNNYLTDVLSGFARSYITSSRQQARPFFLEVATFAPHEPFTPAPEYAHLYPKLQYPRNPAFDAANVNPPRWLLGHPPLTESDLQKINQDYRLRAEDMKSVDNMIGSIVATLKRTGAWSNTYLVFSSDNGLHMGEHRLLPGKLTAFDTDIRVPLIIVGPHIHPGTTIKQFAENIDLRSTFDAWAGTQPSEGVDGRSLTPLLALPPGGTVPGWPQGVLIEHHGPDFNHRDPDFQTPDSGDPTTYEALRLSGALYVEYRNGDREYYNLKKDPWELDNIYSTLPGARKELLHAELVRLENCHDSPSCSDVTNP